MKKNKATTDLKRGFLQAVLSGDKDKAGSLRRRIMLSNEMPLFIEYTINDGLYYLDWENQVLTEAQFEKLKADCHQKVFWEETKTYETE